MFRSGPACLASLLVMALTCGGGTTVAAGNAHEHGILTLDVAIDSGSLTILLHAPLDNLLGFERVPRNETERQAGAGVLARLRAPQQGTPLFVTDAAARCRLDKAEVLAPVLEPGARPAGAVGHADVEANYTFACARPDELRGLDLGLFDAFKRIRRIDVQVAGPQGQSKQAFERAQRRVRLSR